MKKILVACRAGVGSSMVLKLKLMQVINEQNLDIDVEHSNLDLVKSFQGDAVFTLIDVAQEMSRKYPHIHFIGIRNIMDKNEIFEGLKTIL